MSEKRPIRKSIDDLKVNIPRASADQRMILKAVYSFDLPEGTSIQGDMALVYLNDVEVARIIYEGNEGEPMTKSVEVDVTDKLVPGDFNVVKFQTQVFHTGILGFDLRSDAEFTLKYNGKKLVKQSYKTNTDVRIITDEWAVLVS